jgi:hypothetical protein
VPLESFSHGGERGRIASVTGALDLAESGEAMFIDAVRGYRTRMRAFERFCEQASLDPVSTRRAFGVYDDPVMDIVVMVCDEIQRIEPDEERAARDAAQLLELWRR